MRVPCRGIRRFISVIGWLCLTLLLPTSTSAQETAKPAAPQPWTMQEAEAHLSLYPRDVFMQYVVLKVAQREGLSVSHLPMFDINTRRQRSFERQQEVDLFSIFSGSLAVQESLQLDALQPASSIQNQTPLEQSGDSGSVMVNTLVGPTVKSHPWNEMLGGKSPEESGLADFVPADQYFIGFRSVSRMLDVLDGGDLFAGHLFTNAGEGAFVRDTQDRLRKQLAVETNPLARPFYDLVVKELAITGSDPFVAEGSDVTLLFRYEQELVFRTQMDQYLAQAQNETPNATREVFDVLGVAVTHVSSPDRSVHVYSAYPKPGLHVRSNSKVALGRCLRLLLEKNTPGDEGIIESLGRSDEFRYIRTLIPWQESMEDGLIYLSDPFIRRLMGPEVKLTELRRLRCAAHLRMIGHAAAMFAREQGRWPVSLDEIREARCLPDGFAQGALACPCGGEYSLSEDHHHGECSHHGHADALVPCCEMPVTVVTKAEAAAYQQFVTEYEQYWQTFFDPIAIRVKASPESYRLETIVLPLINNSIYQSMAAALQGETQDLSMSPAPDTVLSMSFAIAKERLLQMSGWQPSEQHAEPVIPRDEIDQYRTTCTNLRQIALSMVNFHDVYSVYPGKTAPEGVHTGLSWRVRLLPYVGEAGLYSQFHLDEPWDSEHNKQFINQMPRIYSSPGLKPGYTTYVGVSGDNGVLSAANPVRMRAITDGISQTAMVLDASVDHAVIWTKPDDLPLDTKVLVDACKGRFRKLVPMAYADGSVHHLPNDMNPVILTSLFDIADGRIIPSDLEVAVPEVDTSPARDPFGLEVLSNGNLTEKDVYTFLKDGIGDTIGFHVCDSDPEFDLQMTRILTQMLTRTRSVDDESIMVGFAIASVTAPVYLNVSVEDADIVESFLSKVDDTLAHTAREPMEFGFFGVQKDFYQLKSEKSDIRSFVLSIGPVRWRFFYTRAGNQLVVSSKLSTIQSLIEQASAPAIKSEASADQRAHAQLTIRRENWKQIMTAMRLSWDEGARISCLDNPGPLTSAAQLAALQGTASSDGITAQAVSLYGGRHFCPCGGHYELNEHGKMQCSIHGHAEKPTQPLPGAPNSASSAMLDSFREIQVRLSFLEDGLHAVLEINRTTSK